MKENIISREKYNMQVERESSESEKRSWRAKIEGENVIRK